ncbi:MAG: hypothetical protein DRH37_04470 [Deltaproteobacteria bacterium]|nr:MAG: hypothetical protein DRH37_04470 [Deltaproteobacteria bacterium]
MPRILPRRYRWTVEHWEHCYRTWNGARAPGGRPIWREHCRTRSTPPHALLAADGYRIPFPRLVRRSDAYENTVEVVTEIWLDVDPDSVVEPSSDGGEIDPAEIEAYNYSVDINLRGRGSMSLLSWTDFISHPRAGLAPTAAGIGVSMAIPSGMAATDHFSSDLRNGRRVEYFVLLQDPDGSW